MSFPPSSYVAWPEEPALFSSRASDKAREALFTAAVSVEGAASGQLDDEQQLDDDDDEHHPVASDAEIWSFYLIDWANSVYSTVGISGFLPLLIQATAQEAAGFPSRCPNVLSPNATASADWPFSPRPEAFFALAGAGPRACDAAGAPSCYRGLCAGLPSTLLECRDGAGAAVVALRTPGGWDPTSFATLCVTASVVAQAVVLLAWGALAGAGGARKRVLLMSACVGAAACAGALAVRAESWPLGLPVAVVSNAAFGLSGVIMNEFLALLARARADVRAAPRGSRARAAALEARLAEMSGHGFAAGYCAGVAGIALCVPLLLGARDEAAGYRAALCLAGAWWAFFSLPQARWLRARGGRARAGGGGEGAGALAAAAAAAAARARATRRLLAALPATRTFLLWWPLFSDAVFVVGTLGGLYASARVDWGCAGKARGVLALFALAPLAAAAGAALWPRAARALALPPARALAGALLCVGVALPAAGLAGALDQGAPLLAAGAFWGFHMAGMQVFARAALAALAPRGHEGALFALFELTNRGASWLGPLVLTLSAQLAGDLRFGFAYVAVGALAGAAGVLRIDMDRGARDALLWRDDAGDAGDAPPPTTTTPPTTTPPPPPRAGLEGPGAAAQA
jgi:UMF1 family MFS transporter